MVWCDSLKVSSIYTPAPPPWMERAVYKSRHIINAAISMVMVWVSTLRIYYVAYVKGLRTTTTPPRRLLIAERSNDHDQVFVGPMTVQAPPRAPAREREKTRQNITRTHLIGEHHAPLPATERRQYLSSFHIPHSSSSRWTEVCVQHEDPPSANIFGNRHSYSLCGFCAH